MIAKFELAILSMCVFILAFSLGCGGGEETTSGKPKVIKAGESKTMKEHGTADSPEELARREKAAEAAAEKNRNRQRINDFKKRSERLKRRIKKGSATSFELAELILEFAQIGPTAEAGLEKVEEFLSDEDADVRVAAYTAFAEIRGAAAVAVIEKSFKDEDEQVRGAGVDLWGALKSDRIEPIYSLLDDIDPGVQEAAVKAISSRSADQTSVEVVLSKMSEYGPGAARIALEFAVENPQFVKDLDALLVEALDHSEPQARQKAIRLINDKKLDRYAIYEKLVTVLDDEPEEEIRESAYETLRKKAGEASPEYDASKDRDERESAVEAWKAWLSSNRSAFSG